MNNRSNRREFLKRAALAGAALPFLAPRRFSFAAPKEGDLPASDPLLLWYEEPAAQWVEALPIGNGRLGAMIFGGTGQEQLQLNEDTLSAGSPYDPDNPGALQALPKARQLIFEGKYREASDWIGDTMMAHPIKQMPYEPVGDLLIRFPGHEVAAGYRRDLDLDTALASASYQAGGKTFRREYFASPADQVIVCRLTCDSRASVSFTATMTTPQVALLRTESGHTMVLHGRNGEASGIAPGLSFEARVRVIARGGTIVAADDGLSVNGADEVLLLIAAATSYRNYKDTGGDPERANREVLERAVQKDVEALRDDHVREHRRLFRRVRLSLGTTDTATLPTVKRNAEFLKGNDPQLAALYFQYGRYLLISCSRPGTQPANLQGLWNASMTPPWECKYTININTEMNYWPAEVTNLSECHEPLLRMVSELTENGSRTAKVQYGAGGWVCHHNTDLWRATAPIDGPLWGFWPTGGAWLSTHLWTHYEFTGDTAFLARAYPVMKGAAQFFVDSLVEEPSHHWLVTCPSLSPENIHPGGVAICAGPTMDMEILRDLFAHCIEAARILGLDEAFRSTLETVRSRLAPFQVGKAGQLQEWLEDWDMEAPERQHRHVSHLYAVYPSNQITPQSTPELCAAARKSLELRGDVGTGWSLAWKVNLWARLHDGDHAYLLLQHALTPAVGKDAPASGAGVYPNLFDAHPPFQIDGNFGAASGIAEMLLQSHTGELQLLPALPAAWPQGFVSGLRARGGFELAIDWKHGALSGATVASIWGKTCTVRSGSKTVHLDLEPGSSVRLDGLLRVL